jgi:hypothetical protein
VIAVTLQPHPYARLALRDLDEARSASLALYGSLAPSDWRRLIPMGEWDVRMLAAHTLSDRWALATLIEVLGREVNSVVLSGVLGTRQSNRLLQESDRHLAPEEILERAHRQRALLRELLGAVQTDDSAHALYLKMPCGYHDRLHRYDLLRALEGGITRVVPRPEREQVFRSAASQCEWLGLLHAMDETRLGERAPSGASWHDELELLRSSTVVEMLRSRSLSAAFISGVAGDDRILHVHQTFEEQMVLLAGLPLQESEWELELSRRLGEQERRLRSFAAIGRPQAWARSTGLETP